ncbi:Zn(II)2Cys6 transcription factor [Aspergillus stella-maris]|uniref:Zn(II)2Cys6 transcription factor n=1 Tax=Aspergillus stella-maris TaxID=1810926 RepID=UPI003CCCC341
MTKSEVVGKRGGPKRASRAKVKSGCRTCKIRKVKCDEAFPVCTKCRSTGRVCDGYGIWGGGGNQYWHRQASDSPRDISDYPPLACISTLIASTDELESFDWFRGRTIIKLPGSYQSEFWTKVLLQASNSEQAVWHAVMALSSTHRVGFLDPESDPATKLEQSTLRHLIKAAHHLHPHFSTQDESSRRVVLVVCLVFVVLDLLRGHFASAKVHLRNGLRILTEAETARYANKGKADEFRHASPESIEDLVAEAFFRLHTQVELLQHQYRPRPCLLPPPIQPPLQNGYPKACSFLSYTAAWRPLDHLMNETFHLSSLAQGSLVKTKQRAEDLIAYQARIISGLKTWLQTYNASLASLQLAPNPIVHQAKAKVHRLILSYHTMLRIMTETSLRPDNESVFDNYTSYYERIVGLLSETYKLSVIDADYPKGSATAVPHGQTSPSFLYICPKENDGPRSRWIGGCDMSHTIIDIGWMIPLFYVAVKCRDRRIRRTAIQLLESTNHREGIWDAKITACVARKVMEVEEGDFFDGLPLVEVDGVDFGGIGDDSEWKDENSGHSSSSSAFADLDTEMVLPESCRIRDLEVCMEGDPLQRVVLFGSWEGMEGGRVCIGEYDVREQRWL